MGNKNLKEEITKLNIQRCISNTEELYRLRDEEMGLVDAKLIGKLTYWKNNYVDLGGKKLT